MKISLTDTWINATAYKKAKASGKPQFDIFDTLTKGLCLRVAQSGRMTWTYVYTSPEDGGRARMTLGTYPATSIDQARKLALAQLTIIETGKDPRNIVAQSDDLTIKELIELRLDDRVREKRNPKTGEVEREALRSASDIEARYYRHVVPAIGHILVKDFTPMHLFVRVLKPIKDEGHMRMAGMVGADLKALFDYAAYGIGVLPHGNPIAKSEIESGLKVKTTYLKTNEITAVWNAMDTAFPKSVAVRRILKLIMLTGCRVSEVAECTRDEFDMQKGLWTIPAARVKNGKKYGPFDVPLSEQAKVILGEAMRDTNGEWLFPNREGDGPIDNHVISTTLRRSQDQGRMPLASDSDGKPIYWTPHDLRRTYVTHLLNEDHNFGYVEFDVAVAVNHVSTIKGTITGKYNQNLYINKKRDVMKTWGAFMAQLVGLNVVALREVA